MRSLTETIVLGMALIGIAMCIQAAIGCTPKAVDCRVEWLKMADAGLDGAK